MVEKSPLRELARKRGRKTRPGSAREFVRRVGLGAPSLEYGWPLWVALTITAVVVRRMHYVVVCSLRQMV